MTRNERTRRHVQVSGGERLQIVLVEARWKEQRLYFDG